MHELSKVWGLWSHWKRHGPAGLGELFCTVPVEVLQWPEVAEQQHIRINVEPAIDVQKHEASEVRQCPVAAQQGLAVGEVADHSSQSGAKAARLNHLHRRPVSCLLHCTPKLFSCEGAE